MKAALLVLSDIHITSAQDPILAKARDIACATYPILAHVDAVLVLVAGDVAFSGKRDQYVLASQFFAEITKWLQAEGKVPVRWFAVPGNHDCDFDKDGAVRQTLIDGVLRGGPVDDQLIDLCTSVQLEFFAFRNQLEDNTGDGTAKDHLWRSTTMQVAQETITVEAINMAWLSKLRETVGGLTFPWNQVAPGAGSGSEKGLRIAIQHHPANWISQTTYRPYRAFLKQRSHLVITGHEHVPNVGVTIDTEAATTAFIECGPLQEGTSLESSSFLVLTIDTSNEKLSARNFRFDGERYVQSPDFPWEQERALMLAEDEAFRLRHAFEWSLNDPGAPILDANGREIELADFFVFPDMADLSTEGKSGTVNIYPASDLCKLDIIKPGVFIIGEEKSGRTSLLYQLFLRYRDAGLVPVLISGEDLKHTQPEMLGRVVRAAYEAQYETAYVEFEQLSKTNKILIVDDFQFTPIKNEQHRSVLLENLGKFASGLLFSCDKSIPSERFELSSAKLRRFGLQPFGFRARHELIKRWHGFSDPDLSEAEFLVRCDESERVVNHVMTRKVIPALPLYLVTLLQSLTVRRGAELIDSSLGHYYHYLITEAFRGAKASLDKFNELFDYCSHLAWEFYRKDTDELSETMLRQFTNEYSKVWTTVDFQPRLEFLLNAKILERRGSSIAFRYPYVHYYLKGRYLASRLEEPDVRAYIENACTQLYVRDNANTVLFLAHHAHDEFFIQSIQRSLDGLFEDCPAVTFDGDVTDVTALITNAPKIVFNGGTPEDHRIKAAELHDDMDDGSDGLMEAPEPGDHVSFQAEMTTLFKTTEVLGLILKAQYSGLRHDRKQALLASMFNGLMRGLHSVYDGLIRRPEFLQQGAEQLAEQASKALEDRRKRVERVIALIIELISFAYVMHAAECARSPELTENVEAVAKQASTTAFDLIAIAICLDSGNGLPRAQLRYLQKKVKNNLVASRLLTFIVLYRLYMFETSDEDKLWVRRQFSFGYGATQKGSAIAGASSSIAGLMSHD
ncbi:metallophosphoesterase [Dyella acidisoli]|uniref:Calcineurin-like phosphoesterase domain-containing protein n=1 Tax=Dyella acidisoli TaxID=1867834 RepID=A0ABQ5XLY3_9GAMM|nr:metallophosphoesterase family protein [Dyella acidisoli]GLQ91528.1 hypothetical protein GCM10007901_04780 [Dyella acidisoli]